MNLKTIKNASLGNIDSNFKLYNMFVKGELHGQDNRFIQ